MYLSSLSHLIPAQVGPTGHPLGRELPMSKIKHAAMWNFGRIAAKMWPSTQADGLGSAELERLHIGGLRCGMRCPGPSTRIGANLLRCPGSPSSTSRRAGVRRALPAPPDAFSIHILDPPHPTGGHMERAAHCMLSTYFARIGRVAFLQEHRKQSSWFPRLRTCERQFCVATITQPHGFVPSA